MREVRERKLVVPPRPALDGFRFVGGFVLGAAFLELLVFLEVGFFFAIS